MKYVITGGAGHTSKPIIEQLLRKGHQVSVIGRNAANLQPLVDAGAKALIGSIEDPKFVESAFAGADAVYTMNPPNFAVKDWKASIAAIGDHYARAIDKGGVKYVVNLSSIGGHLATGAGPINGLHFAEESLNALKNVEVLHLRPGYFYDNYFANIGMIKQMNIIGANTGDGQTKIILSAPADIADLAAARLAALDFSGHSALYIPSAEALQSEVARALGTAVGKPDLPWVEFTDEQSLEGMLAAGLPEEIAKNYVEMNAGFRTGHITEHYWKNRPTQFGKTTLADFAKTFAQAYSREN